MITSYAYTWISIAILILIGWHEYDEPAALILYFIVVGIFWAATAKYVFAFLVDTFP